MNVNSVNSMNTQNGVKKVNFTPSTSVSQGNTFSAAMSTAMGKEDLEAIFKKASMTYQVPIDLLKAVAYAESGFRSDAVSSCGAQGIMQLMPATAKSLGVTDPFDPEQNIMAGAKCLAQKLKEYQGNVPLTLASYNAGSGNVRKYGGIPPFEETKKYISKIMGLLGKDLNQELSVAQGTTTISNTITIPKTTINLGPTVMEEFDENSLLLRQIEAARNSDWMIKYQELFATTDNLSKEKDS